MRYPLLTFSLLLTTLCAAQAAVYVPKIEETVDIDSSYCKNNNCEVEITRTVYLPVPRVRRADSVVAVAVPFQEEKVRVKPGEKYYFPSKWLVRGPRGSHRAELEMKLRDLHTGELVDIARYLFNDKKVPVEEGQEKRKWKVKQKEHDQQYGIENMAGVLESPIVFEPSRTVIEAKEILGAGDDVEAWMKTMAGELIFEEVLYMTGTWTKLKRGERAYYLDSKRAALGRRAYWIPASWQKDLGNSEASPQLDYRIYAKSDTEKKDRLESYVSVAVIEKDTPTLVRKITVNAIGVKPVPAMDAVAQVGVR